MLVAVLLLASLATATAALRPPPSFSIVSSRNRAVSVQVVGPRKLRRKSNPKLANLQRQLASAESWHKDLAAQVETLDTASYDGWAHQNLKALKRKKLMAKDKIDGLTAMIRRLKENEVEELGSGSFGRVLLGHT